jgi:hypothetical protein
MRDCSNGEVRDRLPELMHDRLHGEAFAVVRAHVDGCADCQAELELLQQIRGAAVAPRVDTSRIVASLPRYRAVPVWRRAVGSAQLRAVAAAVVLLVGGYAIVDRQRSTEPHPAPVAQTQTATGQELAIGDSFQDLTDSDLAAVIENLGSLEAVTPEATEEPLLPIAESAARSTRTGGGA